MNIEIQRFPSNLILNEFGAVNKKIISKMQQEGLIIRNGVATFVKNKNDLKYKKGRD